MFKHRSEQVYDDEISPLVSQIIAIARRERMPLLISAGMRDEHGGEMTCDTALIWGDGGDAGLVDVEARHRVAFEMVRDGMAAIALTTWPRPRSRGDA